MQGIILNSRPIEYRARFHEAFAPQSGSWQIVDCPVLRTEIVTARIPQPGSVDLLIFTSQAAVSVFPATPAWVSKRVCAVGEATAAAARAAGFKDVLQTGNDVADLRRYLAASTYGAALYASGEEVTDDIASLGPRIDRLVVYRMTPRDGLPEDLIEAIRRPTPVIAPLFSKRSANVLADLLQKARITAANASIVAVAISKDVLADGPWRHGTVAARPTLAAVAAAVRQAADGYSESGL